MKNSKRAFITGICGQDGSYLAEYLLREGYEVMGLHREEDAHALAQIKFENEEKLYLCRGDITDVSSYEKSLKEFAPDELYNLAAVSDLHTAQAHPDHTLDVNVFAFKKLISALYENHPETHVFHALSSRILVPDNSGVISESSVLSKSSHPYDVSKMQSLTDIIIPYRKNNFFISGGYLCNHESPRRGTKFVSGKIAKTVANIHLGREEMLQVGNLDAKRDWSFAGDVVVAMQKILQLESPGDFVIGSGKLHSVKDFVTEAFLVVGKTIAWEGEGISMRGYDESGALRVMVMPELYREDDNPVVADVSYLKMKTGWDQKVSFTDLVNMMVRSNLGFDREQ